MHKGPTFEVISEIAALQIVHKKAAPNAYAIQAFPLSFGKTVAPDKSSY